MWRGGRHGRQRCCCGFSRCPDHWRQRCAHRQAWGPRCGIFFQHRAACTTPNLQKRYPILFGYMMIHLMVHDDTFNVHSMFLRTTVSNVHGLPNNGPFPTPGSWKLNSWEMFSRIVCFELPKGTNNEFRCTTWTVFLLFSLGRFVCLCVCVCVFLWGFETQLEWV